MYGACPIRLGDSQEADVTGAGGEPGGVWWETDSESSLGPYRERICLAPAGPGGAGGMDP